MISALRFHPQIIKCPSSFCPIHDRFFHAQPLRDESRHGAGDGGECHEPDEDDDGGDDLAAGGHGHVGNGLIAH